MALHLAPISQRRALAFVALHHRHNVPPRGSIFQVAVETAEGEVVGVAIAGRPVARGLDNGRTLEVVRVCTTGYRNAASMLYGACARAGVALGFDPQRIITYTLAEEPGTSLRAAGWVQDELLAQRPGGWDTPSRPRDAARTPNGPKVRWRSA